MGEGVEDTSRVTNVILVLRFLWVGLVRGKGEKSAKWERGEDDKKGLRGKVWIEAETVQTGNQHRAK